MFFIPSWSEETLFFNLNLHIKIHQFVWKNSQTAGVNRAKKSLSVHNLYTDEVTDCLKPAGTSVAFIHQHLKNSANPCICSITHVSKIWLIILKLDQVPPSDRSNFVCLSSKLRISGFYNSWMENRCRVVLKRCVNVIGYNACTLAWLSR